MSDEALALSLVDDLDAALETFDELYEEEREDIQNIIEAMEDIAACRRQAL